MLKTPNMKLIYYSCIQHLLNRYGILLLMMLLPFASKAQSYSTGSKISRIDATMILDHHNKVREEVGVGPLVWDPNIASYAQSWADHLAKSNCKISHRNNSQEEGRNYGENIFWGSSSTAYAPLDASVSWYEEKEGYRYKVIRSTDWSETGHYTQMVWRKTRSMGAGMAVCPSGAIIVVANYDPPGNFIGQYPY